MILVLFSGDDSNLDGVGKLSQKLKIAIENENIRFVEECYYIGKKVQAKA